MCGGYGGRTPFSPRCSEEVNGSLPRAKKKKANGGKKIVNIAELNILTEESLKRVDKLNSGSILILLSYRSSRHRQV